MRLGLSFQPLLSSFAQYGSLGLDLLAKSSVPYTSPRKLLFGVRDKIALSGTWGHPMGMLRDNIALCGTWKHDLSLGIQGPLQYRALFGKPGEDLGTPFGE